jgi:hypothetical protein
VADIDIVKKRSTTWIWVLLVALLLLAIWFFMAGGGTEQQIGSLNGGAQPLTVAVLDVLAGAGAPAA